MTWALGIKLAAAAIQSFLMVERSKTAVKGDDKTNLSYDFTSEIMGNCGETKKLQRLMILSEKVRERHASLAKAYVEYQNTIADEIDRLGAQL